MNASKTLFWFTNVHEKAKEPAGRIVFTHAPQCHDIHQHTCRHDRMDVIVGLSSGDLVWIDPIHYRCTRMNKNGLVSKSPVRQVRWIPFQDTRFLSAHEDGSIYVWDVEREDPPEGFEKKPNDSTWNPKTSIVVEKPDIRSDTSSSGVLKMGRHRDHQPVFYNPVAVWNVSRRPITDMAFSPDAVTLAVTSEDQLLHLIDVKREVLVRSFSSYFGGFKCSCWSPDGRFLLTGGQDDLICIWAPHEGHLVARAQGHDSYVSTVAFDPWCYQSSSSFDAYRIISVGEDGRLCLWDFSSSSLHRPRTKPIGTSTAMHTSAFRHSPSNIHIRTQPRADVPMLHPTSTVSMPWCAPCALRIAPYYLIVLRLDGEMDVFSRPKRAAEPPRRLDTTSDFSSGQGFSPRKSDDEPISPDGKAQRHTFRRTLGSPFTRSLRKSAA